MTRRLAAVVAAVVAALLILGGCAGMSSREQVVTVGQSFTLHDQRMEAGWKITGAEDFGRTGYLSFTRIVGTVTNVSGSPVETSWHFEFTRDGVTIGRADLDSSKLWPGKSEQVKATVFAENVKELVYDHITVTTN